MASANGNGNGPPDNGSPRPAGDVLTHRIIVIALGMTVLFTALNMTILQALGKEPQPALANLGAVALGALAMLTTPLRRA